MINRDLIKQENEKIMQGLTDALQNNDIESAAAALQQFQDSVGRRIEEEFEQYKNVTDMAVLQSRGLRSLTTEETAFYQKLLKAASAPDNEVKQAITNLTDAMPPTIIDRVLEDMAKAHPLLGALDIRNAAGATKLIVNGTQIASKAGSWGVITSAISQQVAGQITVIDITTAKYTAYFSIPKDYVKFNFSFAPMWVDQYIRVLLSEVIANGLENAFLNGDGNDKPIGMKMDISTSSNGTYSAKTAIAITDWEDSYANVISGLIIDGNGDYRNVPEVLLVVNPVDYVKKVRQVQSTITSAGIIDMISHTYPTRVVTSAFMSQNSAVVGVAKNYFAAINGGQSGIIEYSDEAQFLADERLYTTRVYGQGRPVDNTSFALLDISGVSAPAMPVNVKNTVKTKEQA